MERLFSRGRILLPHLRNCLSSQSICALLCLSSWSRLGFVKDDDIKKVVSDAEEVPVEGEVDNDGY